LTVDEAIRCYLDIMQRVYTVKKALPSSGMFSAQGLEAVMSEILGRYCNDPQVPMIEEANGAVVCHV
jgi:hypothetical protein